MPKELTHWIIAERIRSLVKQGPVKEAINRHPHFYYLGAVVYDCPFYASAKKDDRRFAQIADKLHGVDGGDTFEPFRSFFSFATPAAAPSAKPPPPEAVSFICGAFTHYSLDVTFHPMVNYFSGKYFADDPQKRAVSQMRHRQFESLLDLYFYGKYVSEAENRIDGGFGRRPGLRPDIRLGGYLLNGGRLSRTLLALAAERESLSEIVGAFYGNTVDRTAVIPLLRRHGKLQKQFFNRLLAAALLLSGTVLGGPIAVVAGTFYPPDLRTKVIRAPNEVLPFFAAPLSFNHPNTGEKLRGSAEDFAARAAGTAANLVNGYQTALENGKGEMYLSGKRGLSLGFGCDVRQYPEPVNFDVDTPIRVLCRKIDSFYM